jgi:transglutaminase-like putative cysteine protease
VVYLKRVFPVYCIGSFFNIYLDSRIRPVWLSPQVAPPAAGAALPDAGAELFAEGESQADHFINWQQDPYSNRMARLVFPKQTRGVGSIEVDLVAEMTVINPFDFFLEPERGAISVCI